MRLFEKLFTAFCVMLMAIPASAQWTLNTTLAGELNDVYYDDLGNGQVLVAGNNGAWYSDNEGATWFNLNVNAADQALYNRCKWYAADLSSDGWVIGGEDTVNNTAVIFRSAGIFLNFSLDYIGPANTTINAIRDEFAVGNNGLAIRYDDWNNTYDPINVVTTQHLRSVGLYSTRGYIVGDSTWWFSNQFNIGTWTEYPHQYPYRSVYPLSISFVYAVAENTIQGTTTNGSSVSNYNNYPLPFFGTDIVMFSTSDGIVTTGNGTLRAAGSVAYWEEQPSASGYFLNALNFDGTSIGFAVGKNGVVLKTTNAGGSSIPYINFSSDNGACLGDTMVFTNHGSYNYGYTWYVDGLQVSTNHDYEHIFAATGTYTIDMVADNSGVPFDTASATVTIVDPPPANLPFTVVSPLLCNEGSSDIIIHGSDPTLDYRVYRPGYSFPDDEVPGNGGDITLTTSVITDSTYFILAAKVPGVDCETLFDTLALVGVDKAKADFHVNRLNAELNEPMNFYDRSTGYPPFTHYWDFGPGASQATSTAEHPTGISYNSLSTPVILHAVTTQYGCSDTIVKSPVEIYDPTAVQDNDWAVLINDSYDHGYNVVGGTGYDIAYGMNGDIIVAGNTQTPTFQSKFGNTKDGFYRKGTYMASYDKNGILKWVVEQELRPSHVGFDAMSIHDVMVNSVGEIYTVGYTQRASKFSSNDGTTQHATSTVQWNYTDASIAKYDKEGVLLDIIEVIGGELYKAAVDPFNNLYLFGRGGINTTIQLPGGNYTLTSPGSHFIMKLDPTGNLIWEVDADGSFPYHYLGMETGNDGSLYLAGTYTNTAATFGSTDANSGTLPNQNQGDMFVLKYNPNGVLKWLNHMESYSTAVPSDYMSDLKVDGDKIYLTGENDSYQVTHQSIWQNSTGVYDTLYGGEYFLVQYDTAGFYQWGVGSRASFNDLQTPHLGVSPTGGIYVGCQIFSGIDPDTLALTSSDGSYTYYPLENGNAFFAKYSETGMLEALTMEDYQQNNADASLAPAGLHIDAQGNLYSIAPFNYYSNSPPMVVAGDTIPETIIDDDPVLFKIGWNNLLGSSFAASANIPGPFCPGDSISYSWLMAPEVVIGAGNVFELQLSDEFGSFANSTLIASVADTSHTGTLGGFLPGGLVSGGNYQIQITSSAPVLNTDPLPISIIGIPANRTIDTAVCVGTPLTLSANTADSWLWSPGNMVSDSLIQSPGYTGNNSSQLIAEMTNVCGLYYDTFNVTIESLPTLILSNDTAICTGDSIILSVSGANTYLWGNSTEISDTTSASPWVYPSTDTYYTVMGTGTNTCQQSDSVFVSVLSGPTLNVSNDTTICSGDTITLSVTGANTYLWDNSVFLQGTTLPNPTVFPTTDTYFPVTGTDGNTCTSNDSVLVMVNPLPSAPINLSGFDLSTSNDAGDTYQWFLDGSPIGGATANTHTALANGTYHVEVTNSFGCVAVSDTLFVNGVGLMESTGAPFDVLLYPNPVESGGQLVVEINAPQVERVNLSVLDVSGRVIATPDQQTLVQGFNRIELPLPMMSNGSYLLELSAESGRTILRFTVQQ